MSFDSLGLSAELLRAVSDKGYRVPTAVQRQVIPAILQGHDVLAGSQTGSGKTAGFTLPLLQLLNNRPPVRTSQGPSQPIRTLILTPTRELAAQIADSVKTYGRYLPLKSAVVFGGVSINPQIDKLKRGVDVLIATPGRLLDHVGQGTVNLSKVEILVLDEADRMLDMGFIRDIRRILQILPEKRQNLLFSATFSPEIKTLAGQFMHAPKQIQATTPNAKAEAVSHRVYPVDRERKRELLSHLIRQECWSQVLVFTRTKHGANRLAEQLQKDGIHSAAIHGNKSQGARTKALADFKANQIQVLVATDIAARGLDIVQLPHVVNFDLPNVPEDYIHRIGRTGRAGHTGEAVSLVCIDEKGLLHDIEKILKYAVPVTQMEGFEPNPEIKPEPIFKNRQQTGQRRNNTPRAVTPSRPGNGARGRRPGFSRRQAS